MSSAVVCRAFSGLERHGGKSARFDAAGRLIIWEDFRDSWWFGHAINALTPSWRLPMALAASGGLFTVQY